MPPSAIRRRLEQIGRTLRRWRAGIDVLFGLAALLLGLWLFGLSDLFLRFGRVLRVAVWLVLVALGAAVVVWVARTLSRRFSPEGVALAVEKSFPELDNHLINYLLFARDGTRNVFKEAYIKDGVPGWERLDVRQMKNRKAYRYGVLALTLSLVILLLPALFDGRAWAVAVWRIANPFADVTPVSLTHILAVRPGEASVPQGEPLVLSCEVQGRAGHRVYVDVKPADGKKTTYALGQIAAGEVELFAHRLPKVNADLVYRFRAGDAPFPEWYAITARPPSAFTTVRLGIRPPDYLGQPARIVDALAEAVEIPVQSEVMVSAVGNGPLTSVSLATAGTDAVLPLVRAPDAREAWRGTVRVESGTGFRLSAVDSRGERFETDIAFTLLPDGAPVIEIVAPRGQPSLPPGTPPRIDFAVSDDYGVTSVVVERLAANATEDADGTPVRTWSITNAAAFNQVWTAAAPLGREGAAAFRVVARDTCAHAEHETRSATIRFDASKLDEAADARDAAEEQDAATLARIVDLQRENIVHTRDCQRTLSTAPADDWVEATERQREIRTLTGELLTHWAGQLGSLAPAARRLYVNEMAEVIGLLQRVPAGKDTERPGLVVRALNMEEKILRQLSYAGEAADQTKTRERISELARLLKALVQGESDVLKATSRYASSGASVGSTLVDRQDDLGSDLVDFVSACRREADGLRANDEAFADLVVAIADSCERDKIGDDMFLAAEDLDRDLPKEALPDERRALTKLSALQKRFDAVRAGAEEAREEAMLETLQGAGAKLEKIREMHERALEAMDEVRGHRDASSKDIDLMEEEYEELLRNTKEALLEVPTDLHIFMELNVANELVEDVASVFEEVEQRAGSEEEGAEGVSEQPYSKEGMDDVLEAMKEAGERLDDFEMWLSDKPDDQKITTESFDQEEMPEEGIALGALAAQAEDIIGDLMEEEEELREEADDSATNWGLTDDKMGWDILEGEHATFSAKGKSGNERPDHKEQDGRSNVGRQGMSGGETAAGSGTINEGDEKIEARRTEDPTQDGQVDVDGEADTRASGGGKLGTGKADGVGMSGGTRRMDSTEEGSMEGMEALMAEQVDAIYTKASIKNVRSDSLKTAAHHLRQAADAVARGRPIEQVREFKKRAVVALQRGKTDLDAGASAVPGDEQVSNLLDDVVEGGADDAPPTYRHLVSEYYKALNEAL